MSSAKWLPLCLSRVSIFKWATCVLQCPLEISMYMSVGIVFGNFKSLNPMMEIPLLSYTNISI